MQMSGGRLQQKLWVLVLVLAILFPGAVPVELQGLLAVQVSKKP
jgi:hypothetical protein